jgi:prepilin-type N-terminal cleavage/methylation domain-containing protein
MTRRTPSGNGTGGFSLVELLVAMAVAALLITALLSILSKSMDVSKSANAELLSKSSAQAALDLMVTDLDSLLVNRNAGQVLAAVNGTITNSDLLMLTTSMVDSYNVGGSNDPGAARMVQYQIAYATNFASSKVKSFGLYRNVLDPTNTFLQAIGTNDLSAVGAAGGLSSNLLVPNVVGMNMTFYASGGGGVWSNATGSNNFIVSTNFPPGVVLEVSLTVLDEPYASRFGNGTTPMASNLITQYGRKLVRRVTLPSPP